MNPEILTLKYLANTKPKKGYDERVAHGHDGFSWAYIFPESVLARWFAGIDGLPNRATTLYGVLGVSRDAAEDEIRRAFRNRVKQWHPDVSELYKSTDSQFIRVKEAFDVLSNAELRARYDAGLALEQSIKKSADQPPVDTYRPPRRCGYVLAEMDGSVVRQILDWQDITNEAGRRLVTSWTPAHQAYTESWV